MVPPVYNTRFPWNIIVKGSGMNGRIVSAVAILFCLISQSSNVFGNGETNSKSSGISFELNDSPWRLTSANLFQDQPALIPKFNFSPKIQTPAQANEFVADFFSTYKVGKSVLTSVPALQNSSNVDVILGVEAKIRGAADSGSLLGTTPAAIGVGVQRRTPIYSDPRIRGGRVGRLADAAARGDPRRNDR